MKVEKKRIELKRLDEDGTGLAKIATLSAVDHDGDTYAKGAFGEQQVKILAGHSWDGVPLGKGRVFEKGDEALVEFKLNLDTEAGREWHAALKFDLANGDPLQEWSYGFRVKESTDETREGKTVRVLEKLEVFEVSPVVKGSGVDTGTVAIKSGQSFEDQLNDLIASADDAIKRAGDIAKLRRENGRKVSPERVGQLIELEGKLRLLIDSIKAADDPNDGADPGRLLAQFEAIRHGQTRVEP